MKKENKLVKFTALVVLISVIALILVAGTYAKYTSTATGTSTATVAKWDIKAGAAGAEKSITVENATVAFNLFETILDEEGSEETAVVADENGKVIKIAPGTSGAFSLSVKNDSKVNAEYTVNFAVVEEDTNLPDGTILPLEFKVNDGEWATSLEKVTATTLNMGESDTVTVQWRWAYEPTISTDLNDTTLGINEPNIKVQATLVVDQVD